jgi:hypothetical protein
MTEKEISVFFFNSSENPESNKKKLQDAIFHFLALFIQQFIHSWLQLLNVLWLWYFESDWHSLEVPALLKTMK